MVRNVFLALAILFSGLSYTVSAQNYDFGIDVSHWQGTINWQQVYDWDVNFTFVKATEGVGYTDPKLSYNALGSHDVGIPTGVYHFATPSNNPSDAIAEANYFVSVAGDYMTSGYIRPVLDLEQGSGMGSTALSAWACTFMDRVETLTGVEPIIYCNVNYATNYLNSTVSDYDLWIAQWTYDTTTPPTNIGVFNDWDFWQYSDTVNIPGISGYVDGDVCLDVSDYVITSAPEPGTLTLFLGAIAGFALLIRHQRGG